MTLAAVPDPLAPAARWPPEPPGPGLGGPGGRTEPTGPVANPAGGSPELNRGPVGRPRTSPW
jgi:hypothetical protein